MCCTRTPEKTRHIRKKKKHQPSRLDSILTSLSSSSSSLSLFLSLLHRFSCRIYSPPTIQSLPQEHKIQLQVSVNVPINRFYYMFERKKNAFLRTRVQQSKLCLLSYRMQVQRHCRERANKEEQHPTIEACGVLCTKGAKTPLSTTSLYTYEKKGSREVELEIGVGCMSVLIRSNKVLLLFLVQLSVDKTRAFSFIHHHSLPPPVVVFSQEVMMSKVIHPHLIFFSVACQQKRHLDKKKGEAMKDLVSVETLY